MEKNCGSCKYVEFRTTKKSKLQYGYCDLYDLLMIAVQMECKGFIQKENVTA